MRKGAMSINKVGVIVLGIATVALVYAAYSGYFDQLISGFIGSVEYPSQ